MDGFFVDINCSKILDSNETSYKIFIDKNNMTIVYELIEWIRFIFSLEKCVFLIHENSVIHELEDIRVLEILKPLEIRPCLKSDCIHKKMEKNLLSKLNMFINCNEMRVHKLFQTRCNYIIQKVSHYQQNHSYINEKSNNYSLQPHQNFHEETENSKLDNSPSKNSNCQLEDGKFQAIDISDESVNNENQLNLSKFDTSVNNKTTNFERIENQENFPNNFKSSIHCCSNNLSSLAENPVLNSCVNKKQKTQFEEKKNFRNKSRKIGIPFSLGALLSDIREKAQTEKLKEKQETDQTEKSFSSACSIEEKEDNLPTEIASEIQNGNSLKRKRRRKHKKQNFKVDFDHAPGYTSLNYYEPRINRKPNHIRFSDVDEAMETEIVENHCSINQKPKDFNSMNFSEQSITGTISVVEIHESKNWEPLIKAQDEAFEKSTDHSKEELKPDNFIEKKEVDNSQENLSDLESFKEKIKHPIITECVTVQRMANLLFIDKLKDLQELINQQHLLYLEFDENLRKIEQRNKLEGFIKEYLCLAPHESKFTFQQTAEVLHQSASTKNNFSAYKAAVAWKAIGKYADNLITHPWRKEYRDLKLYCGFYKHEVEGNLVGAELMFEAMGYRHAGQSAMALPGILDPDRVTSVSKDAIIAYVECQIMKQIWEALSTHFNITWLEILAFRENHTGTPEHVIRALTYKLRFKQYQEHLYQQVHTSDCHIPQVDHMYSQHPSGYYNHSLYSGPPYSLPVNNRYGPIISPHHIIPVSSAYPTVHPSAQNMLKPHDIYNGYHTHHHYSPQVSMPHLSQNGYSVVPGACPTPTTVPTGQLIELDSSPTHNGGDTYLQRLFKHSLEGESFYHSDGVKHDEPSVMSKAKNDGVGSWENWEYVYRNLENQGYKKETDSEEETFLKSNWSSPSHNSTDDFDYDDFSDKLKSLNLDSNSQLKKETISGKSNADNDEELRQKSLKEKSKQEFEKTKEAAKMRVENKPGKESPEKTKKTNNTLFLKSSLNLKPEKENSLKEKVKSKLRKEAKPLIVNLNDSEEKWQCITCTYLNSVSSNVCEMCYKSKERGSELNPQPSGGQECPKCTLVNEPGLINCVACGSSLKDSPTYI